MNFPELDRAASLGEFSDGPCVSFPRTARVRIIQGPLRGKKWIVESSNHGCWLGSYEYEKQMAFCREVRKGSVVYDLGA